MKKLLIILAVMLTSLTASAELINGLYYSLDTYNKTASVSPNQGSGTKYSGYVDVPSYVTYDNVSYKVTTIGASAFRNCSSITSFSLPTELTSIEGYAFEGCTGVSSISIYNKVSSIGPGAFKGCRFSSFTIPSSVSSIGQQAFANCTSLTTLTSQATNPPSCGADAFSSVPTSCTLVVPVGSVSRYREANVWSRFTNIQNVNGSTESSDPDPDEPDPDDPQDNTVIYYTSTDGQVVTPYRDYLFGATILSNTYNNGQGKIIFDGEVTTIGDYAFYTCSKLRTITLPSSVTSIGQYAFGVCQGLTSIKIPSSVTEIGDDAFLACI